MKGWGQALITDYVLPTADPPSERIRSWLESEDLGFPPWTKQDYETAFAALGFDVRVMEDRSEEHHRHIRDKFARFVAGMDGSDPLAEHPAHRDALLAEAQRRAGRDALQDHGRL